MGQGFSKPKQRYSQWGFPAVAGTISLRICVISICSILLICLIRFLHPTASFVFCLLSIFRSDNFFLSLNP